MNVIVFMVENPKGFSVNRWIKSLYQKVIHSPLIKIRANEEVREVHSLLAISFILFMDTEWGCQNHIDRNDDFRGSEYLTIMH